MREHLQYVRKLGQGGEGSVLLFRLNGTNILVAAKAIRYAIGANQTDLAENKEDGPTTNEAKILNGLNHVSLTT